MSLDNYGKSRPMKKQIATALVALLATLAGRAEESFDVAVYGGVPCGIAAAVAAAREGANVVLIEPTKHIGGLNASGLDTTETGNRALWCAR